ncbi:hypothetical protein C1J02_20595 [Sulfitobacter sp. SK011]|nr:hypothetical protein C1J02_20595 [Sulfitobacter sp. SK011]
MDAPDLYSANQTRSGEADFDVLYKSQNVLTRASGDIGPFSSISSGNLAISPWVSHLFPHQEMV